MEKFRLLRADEIDCRIAMVKSSGVSLLLYKDARCDMNILDEAVGPMNWQRSHSRENANCTVSIWDEEKKQWIAKEDTGTESFTEKEKGLASDSFKRACFNWGVGRELYTAPFIWIPSNKCEIKDSGRKDSRGKAVLTCTDRFSVRNISYSSKRAISSLEIWNDTRNEEAYAYGKKQKQFQTEDRKQEKKPEGSRLTDEMVMELRAEQQRTGVTDIAIINRLHSRAKTIEDLTVEEYEKAMRIFKVTGGKE